MTISKLKTLGALALTCALVLGGAQSLAWGQFFGRRGNQGPAPAQARGADPSSALGRSVDQLGRDLDETARRTAEMRKNLQTIRDGLEALRTEARLEAVPEAAQFAGALEAKPDEAVALLVEQLKRHPVQPKESPDRVGIYLAELRTGEVTLIADQPAPGLTHCGSPEWSHDGRRIVYDATPGTRWNQTRLQAIEVRVGKLTVTDMGAGNCPTLSPDDGRIFFLSNVAQETGVWLMNADGTDRHRLGDYGKPMWSPEGRQLMIMSYSTPPQVTLMDADAKKSGVLKLSGQQIYSEPAWAGKETIVAVIGTKGDDALALIDVSDPRQAGIKEVLWRRADGPDVEPAYPSYSVAAGLCVFVGRGTTGNALYSIRRNKVGEAKPLVLNERHTWIAHPFFSPDGLYLLFSSKGPEGAPPPALRTPLQVVPKSQGPLSPGLPGPSRPPSV